MPRTLSPDIERRILAGSYFRFSFAQWLALYLIFGLFWGSVLIPFGVGVIGMIAGDFIGSIVLMMVGVFGSTFMSLMTIYSIIAMSNDKRVTPKDIVALIRRRQYVDAYNTAVARKGSALHDMRYDRTIIVIGYHIIGDIGRVRNTILNLGKADHDGMDEVYRIKAELYKQV